MRNRVTLDNDQHAVATFVADKSGYEATRVVRVRSFATNAVYLVRSAMAT